MTLDTVQLGIVWQRLNGLMDEVAHAFVRTSFSTVIRENWDLACSLLDPQGRQLAQSSRSVPSFIGTMSRTVRDMLKVYPLETLSPGDILVTNDPWIASGHLNDITMAKPLFHNGRVIAIVASVFHSVDIGGSPSPTAKDTYEEGIWIPVLKLVNAGVENKDLIALISQNLRVPSDTFGDIRAQFAAYEVAERKLLKLLSEEGLDDLDWLADQILARSETSLRRVIDSLPNGTYESEVTADGYDSPLTIRAAVTINGSDMHIDYAGTSGQIDRPINSVLNYTYAWSAYSAKCLFDPNVPNNEGSFRPVTIHAPVGSILNPERPAPVWARHLMGHYIPVVVFRALAPLLPERAMADSATPIWTAYFKGQQTTGKPFVRMYFMAGGLGARGTADGFNCRSFPSNIASSPVETFESIVPLLMREKRLVPGSGGDGQFRGGLSQRISFESRSDKPVTMTIRHERVKFPARGISGGKDGTAGINLLNGEPIASKSQTILKKGDVVTFQTPGGGGFGDPAKRDPKQRQADIAQGYVPSPNS